MSFTSTLGAKTIHAYTAVVVISAIFHFIGMMDIAQVLGVTLFFGFVALLDELAALSQNINRVDGRLIQVTDQLNEINVDERDRTRTRDRTQSQSQDRNP